MALNAESLVENLIEEVEKRPGLYNKSLKEYSDASAKKKNWMGVCAAIVPEWSELNSEKRRKQGCEVQKKWNNLRTCFRRELNAQFSGQASAKKRKYVYYDNLSFLLPFMENLPSGESNPELYDEFDEEFDPLEWKSAPTTPREKKQTKETKPTVQELEEAIMKTSDDTKDEDTYFAVSILPSIPKQKQIKEAKPKARNFDEASPKTSEDTKDEDTYFALSLVPSLQALTAEEKLDAKIGILKIFKDIRLARLGQSSSP